MSDETAPDPATGPPPGASSNVDQEPGAAQRPGERARDVQDAIEESVHEIEARYSDVRDQLKHANHKAVGFIREHPVTCIAGAVAVGYLVGRMASKRWLS